MPERPRPGSMGWAELHTTFANEAKDFYSFVADWSAEAVDMGDHVDYSMSPPPTFLDPHPEPAAGIIKARRQSAIWVPYIVVDNVEDAMNRAIRRGAKVEEEIAEAQGWGRYGMIRDPFGAITALFEPE
ncbi:MAG: VOC family protein [Dehalococcoidia bacterium]